MRRAVGVNHTKADQDQHFFGVTPDGSCGSPPPAARRPSRSWRAAAEDHSTTSAPRYAPCTTNGWSSSMPRQTSSWPIHSPPSRWDSRRWARPPFGGADARGMHSPSRTWFLGNQTCSWRRPVGVRTALAGGEGNASAQWASVNSHPISVSRPLAMPACTNAGSSSRGLSRASSIAIGPTPRNEHHKAQAHGVC